MMAILEEKIDSTFNKQNELLDKINKEMEETREIISDFCINCKKIGSSFK